MMLSLRNPFYEWQKQRLSITEVTTVLAVDETRAEWIWEWVRTYSIFHLSKMEKSGRWLSCRPADRNRWIEHTWAYARQDTPVLVREAAYARPLTFFHVWEFVLSYNNSANELFFNTCNQTVSDIWLANKLMYQPLYIFRCPRWTVATYVVH